MNPKRELTDQQERFLEALFGEAKGNYSEALRLAGYSPNLRKRDILKSLGDVIKEMTVQEFLIKGPKAVSHIDNLLDNPNTPGAAIILQAAKEILNRSGVSDSESSVGKTGAKVFIMPAKGSTVTISNTQPIDEED